MQYIKVFTELIEKLKPCHGMKNECQLHLLERNHEAGNVGISDCVYLGTFEC